jgi:FKBP-type peptidyl-prolyl cis-trans isomerase
VAVGDFDGNGTADIAVAKAFGKGDVKVYTSTLSATQPLTLYRSFTPTIAGSVAGVRLAAGDFGTFASGATTDATKADGRQELVVVSASGVKPTVQVVDLSGTTEKVVKTVSPFTAAFKGGLHVVAARFNADAVADLVVAPDGGGTSKIQILDGKVGGSTTPLSEFAVYSDLASKPVGVTVAAIDTDGDGRIDQMITNQSRVAVGTERVFDYDTTKNVWTKSAENTGVSRSPLVAAPVASLPYEGMVTTASGLVYRDLVVGSGASPSSSTARVTVNYTGWLLDGTRFDGNSGVSFNLNQVIAGWTEALSTMKSGGRRLLVIPSNLGYGDAGSPPSIPGGATLVFDVELLSTT